MWSGGWDDSLFTWDQAHQVSQLSPKVGTYERSMLVEQVGQALISLPTVDDLPKRSWGAAVWAKLERLTQVG